MAKLNLTEINKKLKSEKRSYQSLSREQVECAKLAQKVSKLTEKISKLASDLADAKSASAKLVPAKPSPSKPLPASGAQASKKLGTEPEVTNLVVPRRRKDFVSK
jgi:hypothetical protein